MFSGGFGGIESDGDLHKMEVRQEREYERPPQQHQEQQQQKESEGMLRGLLGKSLIRDLKTDDLLLIGVAALIFLDGNPDNDLLLFVIAALLLN